MSVLHIAKGEYVGTKVLDGAVVDTITAFLFHRGGHADPVRLQANVGKSFQGSIVLGMGFTFDDTDNKGVASPLAEMHRLIEADPHNHEAIFPYIGGEEVNTSPTHAHHRYAINFRDYPLRRADLGATWMYADVRQRREWLREGIVPLDYPNPVAADWPELLTIVEARAKPERDVQNRKALRERWWQYAEKRPGLYSSLAGLDRVLAINCGATPHLALGFLTARTVFANTLDIFPYQTYAAFSVIQSRPHEIWARFFQLVYEGRPPLHPLRLLRDVPVSRRLGEPSNSRSRRSSLLRAPSHPHDPERRGHDQDLQPLPRPLRRRPRDRDAPRTARRHGPRRPRRLRLDGYPHRLRLPPRLRDRRGYVGPEEETYRYRWPDPVRNEVLARLLALNAERAAEEARAGEASTTSPRASTPQPARLRYRQAPAPRPTLMDAEPKPLWPSSDD